MLLYRDKEFSVTTELVNGKKKKKKSKISTPENWGVKNSNRRTPVNRRRKPSSLSLSLSLSLPFSLSLFLSTLKKSGNGRSFSQMRYFPFLYLGYVAHVAPHIPLLRSIFAPKQFISFRFKFKLSYMILF